MLTCTTICAASLYYTDHIQTAAAAPPAFNTLAGQKSDTANRYTEEGAQMCYLWCRSVRGTA